MSATTSESPSRPGKVWFVTGSSKGFGRIWVEAALQRGDRVAATARKLDAVIDLADAYGDAVLPLSLDVTDTTPATPRPPVRWCSIWSTSTIHRCGSSSGRPR